MEGSEQHREIREHLVVLRAQLGDRRALAELYRTHGPRVRYYLARISPGWMDADDLNQEVWLRVVRRMAELEQPDAFTTWLYRVARNLVTTRLRRRREVLDTDEPIAASIHVANEEEDTLFKTFKAEDVHAALTLLPPLQREALTLRFIERMNYEEISKVVDCRVGTVRSRLHYAKQRMRELLSENPTHSDHGPRRPQE